MTAVEIRHELDENLRARRATRQDERAGHVHTRDTLLALEPDWYREEDVDRVRQEIARVDTEIVKIDERIAVLELLLPAAERDEALIEVNALLEQVHATNVTFHEAWGRL
jgi:hypothetical protein